VSSGGFGPLLLHHYKIKEKTMNQCTYLYSPNDGTNDPAEYLKNVPSYEPLRRGDVKRAAKALGVEYIIEACRDFSACAREDYDYSENYQAEKERLEELVYEACEKYTKENP
jgi:hypothetical protein